MYEGVSQQTSASQGLPPITHAQYKGVQSGEMEAVFSLSSRPRGQPTALPVSYVLSL